MDLPKKQFSSSNFVLIVFFLSMFVTYLISTSHLLSNKSTLFLFVIMVVGFPLFIFGKFPLLVEPQKESQPHNYYGFRVLNPFEVLYFSIFYSGISFFASFFTKNSINAFVHKNQMKFEWTRQTVKVRHRILDLSLLLFLVPLAVVIGIYFHMNDFFGCFITFVTILLWRLRNFICPYVSGIKIIDEKNVALRVFPYNNSNLKSKFYGIAFPLRKSILISDDAWNKNGCVKDYVIAHEIGHIKDKNCMTFFFFSHFFVLVYVIILPVAIINFGFPNFSIIPLITYIIYSFTVGKMLYENSEKKADQYAVKKIGKEACINALKILGKKESNARISKILRFAFRIIPSSRRIKTIDEKFKDQL